MNQFDKTFSFVKVNNRKSAFTLLMCCLLLIFSGCASLLSGVTSSASLPTPVIKLDPTPTPSPTPALLTNSELAQKIVQGMSLNQKLGQMVIVEFYGATLNSDLIQMIRGNHVSGVLIENKNCLLYTSPSPRD